jgi:opacity protein-like surface antigen
MHFTPKKTALSLASLLLLTTAHAGQNEQFNGAYLGISVGGLNTLANISADSEYYDNNALRFTMNNNQIPEITSYSKTSSNEINPMWGARLGWGTNVYDSAFWMGFELFGNFGKKEADAYIENVDQMDDCLWTSNDTEMTLNNTEFGLDIRPGVLLTPTSLLYARVGAGYNVMHLNAYLDGHSDGDALEMGLYDSRKVAALRLGLGFEQKVNCNWAFSVDYIYSYYGGINASGSETYEYEYLSGSSDVDSVRTNALMLGMSYYPMVQGCRE